MQAGREYWGCSQRGRGRQLSVLPLTAQSTCRAYTEQFYQKQQHIAQRVAAHVVINLQIVYRIVLLEIATYSSACCCSPCSQPADRLQNSSIINSNIQLSVLPLTSQSTCRAYTEQFYQKQQHKARCVAAHRVRVVNLQSLQNSSIRNSNMQLSVLPLTAQSTCRAYRTVILETATCSSGC